MSFKSNLGSRDKKKRSPTNKFLLLFFAQIWIYWKSLFQNKPKSCSSLPFSLPRRLDPILPARSSAPLACSLARSLARSPPPPNWGGRSAPPLIPSALPPFAVPKSSDTAVVASLCAFSLSPCPGQVSRPSGGTRRSAPSVPPLSVVLPRLSASAPDGLSAFNACRCVRSAPPGGDVESGQRAAGLTHLRALDCRWSTISPARHRAVGTYRGSV